MVEVGNHAGLQPPSLQLDNHLVFAVLRVAPCYFDEKMTNNLIYGKTVTIQGDSVAITGDTTLVSRVTFPYLPTGGLNPLIITGVNGYYGFANPAIVGPPVSITAGRMTFYQTSSQAQVSGSVTTAQGFFTAVSGVVGTFTAGAVSILFPVWLAPGARPLTQQRIPIAGQVGPVAQPATLVLQIEINGDVRIFKDTISTAWNSGDTFSINVTSPYSYFLSP